MREISRDFLSHLTVELPELVEQVATFPAHGRSPHLQLLRLSLLQGPDPVRQLLGAFGEEEHVAALGGFVGIALLEDLGDDGLLEGLLEDDDVDEVISELALRDHAFLLVAVLPLPEEQEIDAEEVGDESVGLALGDVGVLEAGALALLLNHLLPKLAEGVHGVVLQQDLRDRLAAALAVLSHLADALHQLPLDVVAAEHEVLTANLGLDPLHDGLPQLRLGVEDVLEDGEGDHLEVGVVVEHDGPLEGAAEGLRQLLGDIGVVDRLDLVLRGVLSEGSALVITQNRLLQLRQAKTPIRRHQLYHREILQQRPRIQSLYTDSNRNSVSAVGCQPGQIIIGFEL